MKRFLVAIAVVAAAGLATGLMVGDAVSAGKKIPAKVIPSTDPALLPDMSIGSPTAKIVVVEYASAACPHCAHWHADVYPAFHDKYIATGKVRFIYREVLTAPQTYAMSAFLLGRCAVARSADPTDSTPFFTVVKTFYAGQEDYQKSRNSSAVKAEVGKITGMTDAEITACVTNQASVETMVGSITARMKADGVRSTPTLIVNGKLIEGHELADIDAAIADAEKALKKK